MHITADFLLSILPLVQGASALPSAGGATIASNSADGRAVYMITNEKNNAVVAVPIGQDGLLKAGGSSTATGGAGANGIDGANNQPAAPDPLFSQSSLTLAGNVWDADTDRLAFTGCC
jgi:hypothetical protein